MAPQQHPSVAVLLPTYNGSRYVEQQILSLRANYVPFTLHWLDDHSTDNTRDVVRSAASRAEIPLVEWHQPNHGGLVGSFFQLLECAVADIYLFCDQDDIWLPGKLDATVYDLTPDIDSPVLCSSDLWIFNQNKPTTTRTVSQILGEKRLLATAQDPPVFLMFMHAMSSGQTQGFTRALRDIFMKHKSTARKYAMVHDWWMYDIAIASGTTRLFSSAPTVLRRIHGTNTSYSYIAEGRNWITRGWKQAQLWRQLFSRHAQGLVLAGPTLPPGKNLSRLLELARIVADVDSRRSLHQLIEMARLGGTPWWGSSYPSFWFYAASFCCSARDPVKTTVSPFFPA
jgi:glycosyltransferase involved in cell wall biosynthesis